MTTKNLPKVNIHPIGEKSPNLVTLLGTGTRHSIFKTFFRRGRKLVRALSAAFQGLPTPGLPDGIFFKPKIPICG
jgi:hypothetical protein